MALYCRLHCFTEDKICLLLISIGTWLKQTNLPRERIVHSRLHQYEGNIVFSGWMRQWLRKCSRRAGRRDPQKQSRGESRLSTHTSRLLRLVQAAPVNITGYHSKLTNKNQQLWNGFDLTPHPVG